MNLPMEINNTVSKKKFTFFSMSQKAEHNIETRIWNILCEDTEFGPELLNLLDIGELIWQRGWAEANAGNVSLRITDILVDEIVPLIHDNSVKVSSPKSRLDLTDYNWFLVSAAGSRYREFKKLGFQNFVLIASSQFQIKEQLHEKLITFPLYRKPTSECATHIVVQNWLHNHRPQDKVVLHAHPTDWIILSNLAEYGTDKQKLINDITKCLPEVNIYFPEGFVLLPYTKPGSDELAWVTEAALSDTNIVIWEKHGILVTAENVNAAFDYLEIMSKAAKVYLNLR